MWSNVLATREPYHRWGSERRTWHSSLNLVTRNTNYKSRIFLLCLSFSGLFQLRLYHLSLFNCHQNSAKHRIALLPCWNAPVHGCSWMFLNDAGSAFQMDLNYYEIEFMNLLVLGRSIMNKGPLSSLVPALPSSKLIGINLYLNINLQATLRALTSQDVI